jgi:predicted CoA-binding protein
VRRWLPRLVAALAVAALAVVGCHQDDDRPRYRTVASGDYVDVVQSDDLVGDICPAEVDRQIEELAATFGVSIPEDYKLLARIEESEEVVQENCELVDVSACFFPAQGDRLPLMSSAFSIYHLPRH